MVSDKQVVTTSKNNFVWGLDFRYKTYKLSPLLYKTRSTNMRAFGFLIKSLELKTPVN